MTTSEMCQRVDDAMGTLLEDASALPEALRDHLAECSRCRDARHAAERAVALVEEAGADYAHPADFEARLRAALDAVPVATTAPAASTAETVADGKAGAPPSRRGALAFLRRPRNTLVASVVGAAAAAAVVALSVAPPDQPGSASRPADAWRGEVAMVTAAGGEGSLEICEASRCAPAEIGAPVADGARLRTDGRTRARVVLSDGSVIVLDRDTELSLAADAARRATLARGAIVAEIARDEAHPARFDLPAGRVDVLGTKFALRAEGAQATVDVSRGAVRLTDGEGRAVEVRAGEEGRLLPGTAPFTTFAPSLGDALSWSEAPAEEVEARGLGELRAKKPGESDERQGEVRLTSHRVSVRIVDGFARTEIEEEFTNDTGEVLEGIYRFPLPPGAQIERLALDVPGGFEEGAFVDRDRAAAIWRGAIVNAAPTRPRPREEIVWVPGPWKDPALLEWQRGGRFELRIFPIPAKGARKIILAYTERVPVAAGVRRYTYPLPHDTSGDLRVDRFDLDLEIRGHDASAGVLSAGYELRRDEAGAVTRLAMNEQGFVPSGDLVVEFASADRGSELSAWAYAPVRDDDGEGAASERATPDTADEARRAVKRRDPYLAVALRPSLPAATEEAQRAYALVVDTSRSMYGERHRRAAALAARLVRELDPLDRFTVLACDVTCRTLGPLASPSRAAADDVQRFLAAIEPEGGSDPAAALREAAAYAGTAEGRRLEIVYLGDGTPTVGPARPSLLRAAVEQALPPGRGRVTTVAIGTDADAEALAAMARAGGGVSLPYVPGQRLADAAYDILGATLGHALRDVSIELPPGAVQVAPTSLPTVVAGGEILVTARLDRPRIEGEVVLRGKLGEAPFERRYPLDIAAASLAGNAFVPRLYAAARIGDLERDGGAEARTEAVAWSQAFNVASRFTSLLVLESPAMFKAFGLDNTREVEVWTGEELTLSVTTPDLADGDGVASSTASKKKEARRAEELFAGRDKLSPGERAALPAQVAPPKSAPQPPPPPASGRAMMDELPDPSLRRDRRMVPMRKVWERRARIFPGQITPVDVTGEAIAKAEAALSADRNVRKALIDLFALHMRAGDLGRAEALAERWSEKEALDPEALTARADLAARRGERERAIRILGSVIDVRPGDLPALERLARLHRWAGEPERACRYLMSVAQLKRDDAKAVAAAVRCSRDTGQHVLASEILRLASDRSRAAAERAIADLPSAQAVEAVRGELQLSATWQGGHDLDLALIDPDGRRVSWLGAPTRGVISAADVTAAGREQLGLLGSLTGEYTIEVVRARGEGPATGEVVVRAPGGTRTIPFSLAGDRVVVGTVRMGWTSRLVPL